MRRFLPFLFLSLFVLSGCMQSEDHLVLNEDGSGTLESKMVIPRGTVSMIDMVMGQMMNAMAQAFNPEAPAQAPTSVIDQLLTDEDVLTKAKKGGAQVKLLFHNREERDDGVHAHYKFEFDDIEKLLTGEGVSAKVDISKNAEGQWVCRTIPDESKAQESKMQLEQFKDYKNSEEFQNMDPIMRMMMMEGFKNLKFEFKISMPYKIKKLDGAFQRVNDTTAKLSFSGDLFNDPTLLDKIYGLAQQESMIVWDSQQSAKVSNDEIRGSTKGSMKGSPKGSAKGSMKGSVKGSPSEDISIKPFKAENAGEVSARAKVYLKSGQHFEGKIVEQNEELIRLDINGITITFYQDQISSVNPR